MDNTVFTMTPGSAVADKLQEILAARKMEARQAMLDALTKSNVESEIDQRRVQGMNDTERAHNDTARTSNDTTRASNDTQIN
jgi:hypothetical protein